MLLLAGVVGLLAEALLPTAGVLATAAAAALLVGGIMLGGVATSQHMPMIIIMAGLAVTALLAGLAVVMFFRSRRNRAETGGSGLIGLECTAMEDFQQTGRVWLRSESWQAVCHSPVHEGQRLIVTDIKALTAHVRPLANGPPSRPGD